VQRYATTGLIFRAGAPNATASLPLASGAAVISSLAVVVDDMTPALALRVSESYLLTINASGAATLTAPTQWGAMRGLETFSQAVQYRGGGAYTISNLPLRISDKPRFAWRGLTIDCSRHFIEIPALLRAIDAMSYTKMNILHLHVSDDQSWSLHSSRYPAFTEQGAFSTPSAMYSVAQQQHEFRTSRIVVPTHATPQFMAYSSAELVQIVEDAVAVLSNCAVDEGWRELIAEQGTKELLNWIAEHVQIVAKTFPAQQSLVKAVSTLDTMLVQ
jgi:hypothetical protein